MYIHTVCMFVHSYVRMYNGWMNVSLACTIYFTQVLVCCIHLKTEEHCTLQNIQSCRSTYACVSLPAQTDRAVQLLLESESTHPCYYTDSLKACLATAIDCNATAQSTVKFVSTNLIALMASWLAGLSECEICMWTAYPICISYTTFKCDT